MCIYINIYTHTYIYGASLVAQLVKNLPAMWETWVRSLGCEEPLERGKAGYPFQYSGLNNSMDCIVLRVVKSWTQLSEFHFHTLIYTYIYMCIYIVIYIYTFLRKSL